MSIVRSAVPGTTTPILQTTLIKNAYESVIFALHDMGLRIQSSTTDWRHPAQRSAIRRRECRSGYLQ